MDICSNIIILETSLPIVIIVSYWVAPPTDWSPGMSDLHLENT